MKANRKHRGFSLAEVLLAIGVLAVGMVFVAGVFPVSVHLTTVVAEQTIAAIAADEAFAKVKLYNFAVGIDFSKLRTATELMDFSDVLMVGIDPCEFAYPSIDAPIEEKHYYWTALCRQVDPNDLNSRLVQVTVFVCRKTGPSLRYRDRETDDSLKEVDYPVPVKVKVSQPGNSNELLIGDFNPSDGVEEKTFVNDGYTIVDDKTGQIYRVLERYASPNDSMVLLDRNWEGSTPTFVWVVPPPVGGGRGPCVGVYQRVIRF